MCLWGCISPRWPLFCAKPASAWRVAWGPPTGQAFGRLCLPHRTGMRTGCGWQEGTDRSHTQARRVFDSISRWLSLRAYFKCKKGNGGGLVSRVAGRRQNSDLIWTLGCHRSCSEQVFQSLRRHYPAFGPWRVHTQSGHALFRWHRLLCAARQNICNVGPSFPKSPLLRIINKQSLHCWRDPQS